MTSRLGQTTSLSMLILVAALTCLGCSSPSEPTPKDMSDAQEMTPSAKDMAEDLAQPEDMKPDLSPEPLVAKATGPAYARVGELITLDAASSTGATKYQWSFGDGRAQEPAQASSSVNVQYDKVGRYRVVLTAYNDIGDRRTTAITVTVTKATTHTPNHSSSVVYVPAAKTPTGRELVGVVSEDASTLSVYTKIAPKQWALTKRYDTCKGPRSVAWSKGWWALTCPDEDLIAAYEHDSDKSISLSLDYGSRPFGIITHQDKLWIAAQGKGTLLGVEHDAGASPTLTLTKTLAATQDARGVAALPDGRLAVSRWRSQLDGHIAIIDPSEAQPVSAWRLPYDDRSASDTEHGGIPNYLDTIAISPQGDLAIVPSLQANVRQGLFLNQLPLAHDLSTRAVLSFINPTDGAHSAANRYQYDSRGLATAATFSPQGDYLYVLMRGMRSVERFDVLRRADSGTIFEVGYAPQGLAISEDGETLFVDASLERQLVIYDITDWQTGPTELAREPLASDEPLPPQLLRGKQLFNDSYDTRLTQEGYVACAHCHLDGQADLQTWDFTDRGEGLRNTTSLVGRAGGGHGPIHWSGNFDEIQDFEHDIRGHFGGSGLLSDEQWAGATTLGPPKAGLNEDLDALAAYVTSLNTYPRSPYRSADGQLSEAAARGQAIFEDSARGCTGCHAGARLTDSAFEAPAQPKLHDVGTIKEGSGKRLNEALTGIDTPTLFELFNSAPYLHDGSALDVIDAVVLDGLDRHGKVNDLSTTQLNDLRAYLLSLDGRP